MIKLYCDMCGKESNALYSINSKMEYQGIIKFAGAIDMEASIFESMDNKAEDSIRHKTVCKVCKEMLFATMFDVLNEFKRMRENE